MINRFYSSRITKNLHSNKVLVVYGPRQVGKTTLIKNYLKSYKGKVYQSTGEDAALKDILYSEKFSTIIPFFSDYDLLFIDEAQKIENIGQSLKIIVDQIPGIKIIATGSSSFDLSNKIGEPLVGRQNILKLFPISSLEIKNQFGAAHTMSQLDNFMIFGSYPEIINIKGPQQKIDYLSSLRNSYLLKDILELTNIKNSKKILDLLKLVAHQIGQEVSIQELGNNLDMSKNTVESYLDLLEKSFIVFNIRGFSKNLRKEISKTSRYYFFDNGVRNAVINNFNPLDMRSDKEIGQLWENYLFIERFKKQEYKKITSNNYFWRTWNQKEIDLVEEREGKLFGYEFKWGNKIPKPPQIFLDTYPNSTYQVINKENYLQFIT
jgi:hypothetical protein